VRNHVDRIPRGLAKPPLRIVKPWFVGVHRKGRIRNGTERRPKLVAFEFQ
jgi:hypothetical protein